MAIQMLGPIAALAALFLPVGVALPLAVPAGAQEVSRQDAPPEVEGETIVVEGMTFRPEDIRGLAIVNPRVTGDMLSRAQMFVSCIDDLDLDLVARVVDGPPQGARTRFALDRLIRTRRGCYYGFPIYHPEQPEPFFGDCNPVITGSGTTCRAPLDRGALFMGVLERYAAAGPLTRAQLFDPAVQARFLSPRN